ncbi:MAG: hypothetical protein HPY45_12290 [Anaerolineae bacterium]|nr:hypothetical protein [Anaerolineae bacterium]
MRAYTRSIEFDYITWSIDAFYIKLGQAALGDQHYLDTGRQTEIVKTYLQMVSRLGQIEAEIDRMYTDPSINDPDASAAALRAERDRLRETLNQMIPLCEAILQQQMNATLAELGFTLGGQSLPPLLYHATPLPDGLIISPREVIRQEANISLNPDMPLESIIKLEQEVEKGLNVSALVVGIGGVGVYPTMVMRSSDLFWFTETIAHEWIHNYLTLRPLGISYEVSPELRTMNETTASIAGKEIGQAMLKRFYPEFLPPPPPVPPIEQGNAPPEPAQNLPAAFDFRAEMHETRVRVDALLAEGKIEAAETYMEMRRKMFWENGYQIRRLNQAYFAFHGAYADVPGGEAGADPVGPAVRALRQQSRTLAEFVNRISWMTSFEQLQRAIQAQ